MPAGFRTEAEIVMKRSRFVAVLARADGEVEARAVVAEVRKAHPEARHHCTAFIVDAEDADAGAVAVERSSDDGEPAGTAGRPMLEVLRGAGLGRVVVVVARYFGGVKLGTGGLARAYADAVAAALAGTPRVRPEMLTLFDVTVSPAEAGRAVSDLAARGVLTLRQRWGEAEVVLTVGSTDPDGVPGVLAAVLHAAPSLVPAGTLVTEVETQAAQGTPEQGSVRG